MNLIDQIFAQQSSGSAEGQGFGQFFAEGVAQGQRQQQLDMRKRELAMEIAQEPFKKALLVQGAALKQAQAQTLLHDREAEVNAGLAFAELRGKIDPLLASGKIDEAQNILISEGAKNAFLLGDPKGRLKALYDFTVRSQDAKLALLKEKNNGTFTPKLVTLTDEEGNKVPVVQTGPHVSQVVDVTKAERDRKALELREKHLKQDLPLAVKEEVKSLYKQIDRKREQLDGIAPKTWTWAHPRTPIDNPKRTAIEDEIKAMRERIDLLTREPGSTPPPSTNAFKIKIIKP